MTQQEIRLWLLDFVNKHPRVKLAQDCPSNSEENVNLVRRDVLYKEGGMAFVNLLVRQLEQKHITKQELSTTADVAAQQLLLLKEDLLYGRIAS